MTGWLDEQISDHQQVVTNLAAKADGLKQIADRMIDAISQGGRIYILGNGGSAADAQHIAAELIGRFKREGRALPAVALTTDTSTLSAVANDMGFDQVFSRQVEALVSSGDIVWILSVSGRSPNVLRAAEAARAKGATIIGFTGKNGGALGELCDLAFVVDHEASDRVQEGHQLAYHLICDLIERHYRK